MGPPNSNRSDLPLRSWRIGPADSIQAPLGLVAVDAFGHRETVGPTGYS